MGKLITLILVGAALAATAYAQYRMPFHTTNATHCWIARLVLAVTGLAAGLMTTARYAGEGEMLSLLAFLGGFGMVHVPAAVILFFKRQRSNS